MKKIIKSFDLEAAKKGAMVETRDGAQVKDLIYRETQYPIEGFYKAEDGIWIDGCWKINGHWDDSEFDGLDLVIVEYEDGDEEQKEEINSMEDRVEHPGYYTSHPSGVECIDITRHYCFDIGNAIKYLWSAGLKKEQGMSNLEKEIEDCNKAIWYIKDHVKMLNKKLNKNEENNSIVNGHYKHDFL